MEHASNKAISLIACGFFFSLFSTASLANFSMGGGVGFGPKYPGSSKTTVGTPLMFSYEFDNGISIQTEDGVSIDYGFNATDDLELFGSLSVNYDKGRKEKDDRKRLNGMGDIKGTITQGLEVGMSYAKFLHLSVGSDIGLTKFNKTRYDADGIANGKVKERRGNSYYINTGVTVYGNETRSLTVSSDFIYADSKYNRNNFGVSKGQSLASGNKEYNAKAGFNAVQVGLNWEQKFDDNWSGMAYLGANILIGDAADSPLVKRKTSPVGALMVSYTF